MVKIHYARFISVEEGKVSLWEILWCEQASNYKKIRTDGRGILWLRVSFMELTGLLARTRIFPYHNGCIDNAERVKCMGELDIVIDADVIESSA